MGHLKFYKFTLSIEFIGLCYVIESKILYYCVIDSNNALGVCKLCSL